MTNTPDEIVGPIDFVLLEFQSERLTGQAAVALGDLVERGIVRLYDLVVISKAADGTVDILEATDPRLAAAGFAAFHGARSGLVGDDDTRQAAEAMQPGTVAALIVYENTWARPFVAAAMDSGAELIASARIPAADVIAALEALEPVV